MHREVASLQTLAAAGAKVPRFHDGNTSNFEDVEVPLFFVMEHVKGETLDQFIKANGMLSLDGALDVCFDLCKTLRVAIQEGIAHRDIKPENLILRSISPADVVMLDFGLSFNKDAESNFTDTDETLDNKFLSLPERRGPYENKRDFRSDLTSIAGILFYCLTGVAPKNLRDSQGRTPNRSAEKDLAKVVGEPLKLTHLHSFFDRGLNNDIDLRFQTLEVLESRLRRIVSASASEPDEDFADAMKRHVAELYKIDRHNRHARYREELQPLAEMLERCLFGLQQNMKGFRLARHQVVRRGLILPPPEVVWSHSLACSVGGHNFLRIITYSIEEDGIECVLFRTLHAQNRGESAVQKDRVELLRYLPSVIPDAGIIKADLNQAVLMATESLIEGLRKQAQGSDKSTDESRPLSSGEALKMLKEIRKQIE